MKVLTGLELLIGKAEDWDRHQPKRYTLQQELAGNTAAFVAPLHHCEPLFLKHLIRHIFADCSVAQDGAAHVASDTAGSSSRLSDLHDSQVLVSPVHTGALRSAYIAGLR